MKALFLGMAAAGILTTLPATAIAAAHSTLKDKAGNTVAQATISPTPDGVLIRLEAENLPAGTHGFHVHETGKCSPDFQAAGGHFAPRGNKHGVLSENGRHAGDLPNIHVPESGKLTVEFFAPGISISSDTTDTLFDADGSALVVHADADDYTSQPAGAAGARIACGVIERR